MQTTVTNQTNTPASVQSDLELMFGRGRYFAIQCEVYKDAQRLFDLSPDISEKIAKAVATNLGSIFSRASATIKGIDKLNKDGQIKSISDAAKLKNVTLSNEISFLRACDHVNKNAMFHVGYDTKPTLVGFVAEWVESL